MDNRYQVIYLERPKGNLKDVLISLIDCELIKKDNDNLYFKDIEDSKENSVKLGYYTFKTRNKSTPIFTSKYYYKGEYDFDKTVELLTKFMVNNFDELWNINIENKYNHIEINNYSFMRDTNYNFKIIEKMFRVGRKKIMDKENTMMKMNLEEYKNIKKYYDDKYNQLKSKFYKLIKDNQLKNILLYTDSFMFETNFLPEDNFYNRFFYLSNQLIQLYNPLLITVEKINDILQNKEKYSYKSLFNELKILKEYTIELENFQSRNYESKNNDDIKRGFKIYNKSKGELNKYFLYEDYIHFGKFSYDRMRENVSLYSIEKVQDSLQYIEESKNQFKEFETMIKNILKRVLSKNNEIVEKFNLTHGGLFFHDIVW